MNCITAVQSQSIARKVLSLIKPNHEEKNNSSMRPELVLSKRELELLNDW